MIDVLAFRHWGIPGWDVSSVTGMFNHATAQLVKYWSIGIRVRAQVAEYGLKCWSTGSSISAGSSKAHQQFVSAVCQNLIRDWPHQKAVKTNTHSDSRFLSRYGQMPPPGCGVADGFGLARHLHPRSIRCDPRQNETPSHAWFNVSTHQCPYLMQALTVVGPTAWVNSIDQEGKLESNLNIILDTDTLAKSFDSLTPESFWLAHEDRFRLFLQTDQIMKELSSICRSIQQDAG